VLNYGTHVAHDVLSCWGGIAHIVLSYWGDVAHVVLNCGAMHATLPVCYGWNYGEMLHAERLNTKGHFTSQVLCALTQIYHMDDTARTGTLSQPSIDTPRARNFTNTHARTLTHAHTHTYTHNYAGCPFQLICIGDGSRNVWRRRAF
jgi:hypothetical protein